MTTISQLRLIAVIVFIVNYKLIFRLLNNLINMVYSWIWEIKDFWFIVDNES